MSADIRTQIAMMKATTERLGVIHEAQLLQIRNYPILLDSIASAQTSIDIETKLVRYDCKTDGTFRRTALKKKAFQRIVWMIQQVVWSDVIVELNVNGKPIYDSRIDCEQQSRTSDT